MYERTYHTRVLKQDMLPKERTAFPWKRMLWTVMFVGGLIGVVLLIRAPFLQINTVTVEGVHVVDPDTVSQYAISILEGKRLMLFPKKSTLLLSTRAIQRAVATSFPRFETVAVSRDSLHSLVVSVQEYDGVYLWCIADTDCYFMDARGIVFASAPYFSGTAYPKVYRGEKQVIPFEPLTPDMLANVALLEGGLKQSGIVPTDYHFIGDHELDVGFVHDGKPAQLLFDPTRPVKDTLEILYSGMRAPAFAKSFHDNTKVLQYIDLRFSNKMVYKFE